MWQNSLLKSQNWQIYTGNFPRNKKYLRNVSTGNLEKFKKFQYSTFSAIFLINQNECTGKLGHSKLDILV